MFLSRPKNIYHNFTNIHTKKGHLTAKMDEKVPDVEEAPTLKCEDGEESMGSDVLIQCQNASNEPIVNVLCVLIGLYIAVFVMTPAIQYSPMMSAMGNDDVLMISISVVGGLLFAFVSFWEQFDPKAFLGLLSLGLAIFNALVHQLGNVQLISFATVLSLATILYIGIRTTTTLTSRLITSITTGIHVLFGLLAYESGTSIGVYFIFSFLKLLFHLTLLQSVSKHKDYNAGDLWASVVRVIVDVKDGLIQDIKTLVAYIPNCPRRHH